MCFYSHLAPLEGNLLPKNNHMHMACLLPYHNAFLKLLIFVPLGLQKKKKSISPIYTVLLLIFICGI